MEWFYWSSLLNQPRICNFCRCTTWNIQPILTTAIYIYIWFYKYTPFPTPPVFFTLQWRHNGRDSVSNHQPHDCLLNPLFRRRSKKTSKIRVTGLCAGNSPVTGELSAHVASNAENVSIWWRHHDRFWIPDSCSKLNSFLKCVITIASDFAELDTKITIQATVIQIHRW